MESKALELKLAITTTLGVAGTFLGWKALLLLIWVCSMVLDYITGSAAAASGDRVKSWLADNGLL